MPKPKPDHREQVEFKFGPKERRLLDDFQLNQTFRTAGSTLSDLGQGISSIISPYISGGDAGLVMALATAYIVDDRLDLKQRDALNEFLDSSPLYGGPGFGIYPSVFGLGAPVCFCSTQDFPGLPKRWEYLVSTPPWEIWPDEAFEDTYLDKIIDWMRTAEEEEEERQGPVELTDVRRGFRVWTPELMWRWINEFGRDLDPNRAGPWRSINEVIQYAFDTDQNVPWLTLVQATPALTYDDPCPTPFTDPNMWTSDLKKKYRFDEVVGLNEANIFNIVYLWDNQIPIYAETWSNWGVKAKYELFKACGGKPRSEIDSLSDLLAELSISIPGAGLMKNVTDFITPDRQSAANVLQGLEMVSGAGGIGGAFTQHFADAMREEGVLTNEEIYLHTQSADYPMSVNWPVWAQPPKSIYKFQTIHSTVEAIKVLIPWYLGTKFTIQAASAAGSIIPG